ncbi:MAG: hypothetical protein OHK0046_13470 [Anaerolineae bacterium]
MMKRLLLILVLLMLALPTIAQEEEELPLWDGQSRLNILVMGMDRRPGARDTLSVRTDAIFLISINPAEERIGILHIPRDLHFVPAGSADFIRVNTLVLEGEDLQEGYGPYYAMETLQYNLGMYIDRYVMFDFEAFITLVDAVDGVTITTRYTIDDPTYPDMNYGFDPFYLPAGTHTLNGRDALRFARTRHGDNDFVRGERQMQVITALQEKLAEGRTLAQLVLQAPTLYEELSHNIYTDLALEEIIRLGQIGVLIPQENVYTGGINLEYNLQYTLPNGQNVYIPDRAALADLMVELFGEDYFQ